MENPVLVWCTFAVVGVTFLAAHAELSKTHICELEKGKREVGLLTLQRIGDALGMKASDILKAIGS